jgi:hypothetical protein
MLGGMSDIFTNVNDTLKAKEFKVGQIVDVHYNPATPEQSCLSTGFDPLKTLLFAFFLLLAYLIAGAGLAIISDGKFFTDSQRTRDKKKAQVLNIDPFRQ